VGSRAVYRNGSVTVTAPLPKQRRNAVMLYYDERKDPRRLARSHLLVHRSDRGENPDIAIAPESRCVYRKFDSA
jgi:hypothetical protein